MKDEVKKTDEGQVDLNAFKEEVHLDLDKPEELPVDPVAQEIATPSGEDRSAFNCPDCGGEGLKDQQTVCPACNGTGKV